MSSADRCGYCTGPLRARVYRHEKGSHPEPRPAFCSHPCMGYYDNRRNAERRAFLAAIGIFAVVGVVATAIGVL